MNEQIKSEETKEVEVGQLTDVANTPGLLTTKQAAGWLGYTPRMLEARRVKGDGPLYIKISARAVRYILVDLQNWVNARLCSSTSAVISNQW